VKFLFIKLIIIIHLNRGKLNCISYTNMKKRMLF